MLIRKSSFALVIIGTLFFLTACASSFTQKDGVSASNIAGPLDTLSAVEEYKIGNDDVLRVDVWLHPELSLTVTVRPDGKISVPRIGDVQVAGLSAQEVAAVVSKELEDFVREPSVTIILMDLKSREFLSRVRITGAVKTPKSMHFRKGMTVLDVVLEAGSITEFAAPERAKLYRKKNGKVVIINIHLGKILRKGILDTNLLLQPGDIIAIPERMF